MKKIGTIIYTHFSNMNNFTEKMNDMIYRANNIMIDQGMLYEWLISAIFKFDMKKNTVTFIESSNWDTAREPEVGDAYKVDLETGEIKIIKAKGQIYHHKWMFVSDDYDGFDIEESKKWSKKWQSVIPTDKKIKSRIGYKKYWDEYLREYNLEVE